MILFLDDDHNRAALAHQRWSPERRNRTMWVSTAADTISVLEDYVDDLEEVHLDHDLGGERYVNSNREDTGMEVVRWLENLSNSKLMKYMSVRFTVHTWNIPAGKEMMERLVYIGLNTKFIPFGMKE